MNPARPSAVTSRPLASIPFKYRRKSFSDDDDLLDPAYLLPPSPSLSPSRSLSMSSSPPSSPTTLVTSPVRPSHLDNARVHGSSSPTRPSANHFYGYAISHSRPVSHQTAYDHDYFSAESLPKFPSYRGRHPYAIIPPPPSSSSARSSFSSSPSESDGVSAVFSSASDPLITRDDDDDDIEDYGFDLDDLLSGSSPSRRVSFTTSSERDRPCIRTPVKPKAPAFRPLSRSTHNRGSVAPPPTSLGSAKPRSSDLHPDSTRLLAPRLVQPPVTPIRTRTRTRSPRAVSAPRENDSGDVDVNDDLPPSSPIPFSPLSSPLSSPARPSDETVRPVTPDPARDSSLPPSSPIPIPRTPPRDLQREAEMEMDLVASPPSPTLDMLRITSRVSVRALLNPVVPASVAPARLSTPPVIDSDIAMDDVPVAEHDEAQADVHVTTTSEEIEVDADVAPLALDEASASELAPADVTEDAMVGVTRTVETDEVTVEAIQIATPEPERALGPDTAAEITPCSVASDPTRSRSPLTSRAVSVAVSRAQTPAYVPMQDIPSSPLSPAPSSPMSELMDERDVAAELEDPFPAIPVAGPSNHSSRATSVAAALPPAPVRPAIPRDSSVPRMPPRKKARRDDSGRISQTTVHSMAVTASTSAATSAPTTTTTITTTTTTTTKPKPKFKRDRKHTPMFTDSEASDAEPARPRPAKVAKKPHTERAASTSSAMALSIPKPVTMKLQSLAQSQSRTVVKKRSRAVLSDEESEAEAPAAVPVPNSVGAFESKRKEKEKKDGRREKERERKRARARDREHGGSDVELENEPLDATSSAARKSSLGTSGEAKKAKTRTKAPSRPKTAAAAPKSATNITRPEPPLPESMYASDEDMDEAEHPPVPCKREQLSEPVPEPESDSQQQQSQPKAKSSSRTIKAARDDDDDEEDLLDAYELPLPVAELEGMLIETLATARASSLATGAVYGAVMAARPALCDMPLPTLRGAPAVLEGEGEGEGKGKGGRGRGAKADAASRRAWVGVIERVLEAGARRCGVFGKVVNQGTDIADHTLALEARWFYDPDRDEDRERAAVVSSMMRRPGKRSETKKAKRYYWTPLPKMSRWDAEDEL